MAYDEHGYSDEFKQDLSAGTLLGAPPTTGTFERSLAYTAAAPFKAFSSVAGTLSDWAGAPKYEMDPNFQFAPSQTFAGKASDLILGGLLPAGLELAGTGAIGRGIMGARAATNPLATRALSDALGFGLLGAEQSPGVGLEQAGEGALYGLMSGLPRLKRLLPAAALALGSKAFFDYDGGTPIMPGSKFTQGDVNAIAGFGTSLFPGIPKVVASEVPEMARATANVAPHAPPGGLTPEQFSQMFGPEYIQTAKMAGDPLGAAGYTSTVTNPNVKGGLNDILDAALRQREQQQTVERFVSSSNPEASINPQKGKLSDLPEYRRSEGGFMTDEAAIQIAKAGGRGLIGATFGAGAGAMDGDPDTDPRYTAALGAALGIFGPSVARETLQRLQNFKRMGSTAPLSEAGSIFPAGKKSAVTMSHPESIAEHLGIEFGGVHLDKMWTFKDPVTGSNLGVEIGADFDKIKQKLENMRQAFKDNPIKEMHDYSEEELQAVIDKAITDAGGVPQKKISTSKVDAPAEQLSLEDSLKLIKSHPTSLTVHGAPYPLELPHSDLHKAYHLGHKYDLSFVKFNWGADGDIVTEFRHNKTGNIVTHIEGDSLDALKFEVSQNEQYHDLRKIVNQFEARFQRLAPGWQVEDNQLISPDNKMMPFSQAIKPEPEGRNFPEEAIELAHNLSIKKKFLKDYDKQFLKYKNGFDSYTSQGIDLDDDVINLTPPKPPPVIMGLVDTPEPKDIADLNAAVKSFKPLQRLQTETPAFKKWFGKSKAVTETGEPRVFYHGTHTRENFNAFDKNKAGRGFISLSEDPQFSNGWVGLGKHLLGELTNKKAISLQASEALEGRSPRLFPVFVRAEKIWDYKNPQHIDMLKFWDTDTSEVAKTLNKEAAKKGSWSTIEDFTKQMQKAGFDAFYTLEGGARNIHVFNPENIKSATGNSGKFSLKTSDIRGFVMPEMSQAMARATIGALTGSFIGGLTDDPDERQGLVMGGLIGAGAFLFGPAVARSGLRAMSKIKLPSPPSGKPSQMKDWVNMIKTFGTTIEERAGATITQGSTRVADRFARMLSRNLELHLPEAVKSKLLESKGLASLFLDKIDSAILKVALRYQPDDVVKKLATEYLDGKMDSVTFFKQLEPHIAYNPSIANYGKFMVAGREAVNGLQRMLISGIGDPKMKKIVSESIGKYLTRSYRLFTDSNWQPDEHSIQNLISEMVTKDVWKGATASDVENALRQYVREVKANKGAYGVSNFAGGTKINQQILKERKDMSDAWKRFLGEITDPTERIYQTVFRLRPMAEASKYFESLLNIEADGLPQAFRNYAEKESFRSKLLQQLQNANIGDAEKASINQKLTRLAAYQNVEAHPKFGAIQGHIVSLPVWDTLQTFDSATNTFTHPFLRSLTNTHTAIKLGRTAFNPMTVVRNMITAPAFMVIARTNLKDVREAWDIIHNTNHPLRSEILRQGISNVDQVKTEFYKEFQNITGSRFNFGSIDMANLGFGTVDLDIAERAVRRGIRSILDFYRLPDNLVRIGSYISAKRRIAETLGRGMDDLEVIQKATEFTNRYTMNYDAVSPAIKGIRNLPFSNLFISYTAEMARIGKNLTMDVLEGSKGNLARHDRMYAAIPLSAIAILPEMIQSASEAQLDSKDRRDWESAKRMMPDYARTRYRAGIWRDKQGIFHYTDFTPLIPSDAFNQFMKAVVRGDTESAIAVNPLLNWENTPALNIVTEQIAGKDKRTFREFRGGADRVAAIAKEVLPPWMPGGFEYERGRQAHRLTDTGERGITNFKTGIRLTPSEFWATYFGPLTGQASIPGAKLGSLNPVILERRITQEIKNEVANETAYLNDVLKSNSNNAIKARAVERFKVAIATLQENYRARLGVDNTGNAQ